MWGFPPQERTNIKEREKTLTTEYQQLISVRMESGLKCLLAKEMLLN